MTSDLRGLAARESGAPINPSPRWQNETGTNMKNPVTCVWLNYTKSLYLNLQGECEDRALSVEDVASVTVKWALATITMKDGSTFDVELWGRDDDDYEMSDSCFVVDQNGDDAAERVHMRTDGFHMRSVGVDVRSDENNVDTDGA